VNGVLTRAEVREEVFAWLEAFDTVLMPCAEIDLCVIFGRARATQLGALPKWKCAYVYTNLTLHDAAREIVQLEVGDAKPNPGVDAALVLAVFAKYMRTLPETPAWAEGLVCVPRPRVDKVFTQRRAAAELQRLESEAT
jgi:hypothetical protein